MAALNKAIAERRFKQARSFVRQGVNINSQTKTGETALIQLCSLWPEAVTVSMAKRLLKKGASIDIKDNNGLTALSNAVVRQRLDMVELFLEEAGNFDLNSRDKMGNTALFYAASMGNFKILSTLVKALKKFRLSVDEPNNEGSTPLIVASKNGHFICAEYLIKEGKASANVRDRQCWKKASEWAKNEETPGVMESKRHCSQNASLRTEQIEGIILEKRKSRQVIKTKLQAQTAGGFLPRRGKDFTYKDQFPKVYRLYECQLSGSYKEGMRKNGLTHKKNGSPLDPSLEVPKIRIKDCKKRARLLKRNTMGPTKNMSHSVPSQNINTYSISPLLLQRSLSYTDLTKFCKRSQQLGISANETQTSSMLLSPLDTARPLVSQMKSFKSVAPIFSFPTVTETNEPTERVNP